MKLDSRLRDSYVDLVYDNLFALRDLHLHPYSSTPPKMNELIRYFLGQNSTSELINQKNQEIVSQVSISVVLVHFGPVSEVPYIEHCIRQLRLFFNGDIYLCLDSQHEIDHSPAGVCQEVKCISRGYIPRSPEHQFYTQQNTLSNDQFRENYWYKCSRRFLVIHDIVTYFNLENVIHIENDVMVYYPLDNVVSLLRARGYKIGATFANPRMIIPGFMYFSNSFYTKVLAQFFAQNRETTMSDMKLIASFANAHPDLLKGLPVVPSKHKQVWGDLTYYNPTYSDKSKLVFDGAALGQMIGGVDPRNIPGNSIGYVNPDCEYIFSPEQIRWKKNNSLFVPVLNKKIRIINLHIHSKDLKRWSSSRKKK